MRHPAHVWNTLAAGCMLSLASSGCITITPTSPALSWKSLTKPKIQHASYEEKVDEVPSEPKNPAKLKIAYARLMEESGQFGEARKNYTAAAELQPKEIEAMLGLARLDERAGNLEQAELGYKKAVKTAPNSVLAQYSLGQYYATQNRWQEASDALTKAMLIDPDESQSRYALAVALVHTGKVDAALPHFIRTIGDAEAHYNVGLILQEEGQLEDAERHFAMAVTKKPDLTAAQNWLVHVRQQRQSPTSGAEGDSVKESPVIPAGHSASTSAPAPFSQGTPKREPLRATPAVASQSDRASAAL